MWSWKKRKNVKIVIIAGEGNVEGYASITHLLDLIQKENNAKHAAEVLGLPPIMQHEQKSTTSTTTSYSSLYESSVNTTSSSGIRWTVRDDVFVTYEHYRNSLPAAETGNNHYANEKSSNTSSNDPIIDGVLLHAPLTMNTSMAYIAGTKHTFGPEIQIGHVLGNTYDHPIIIVKAGWHDRSLAKDWSNGYQWYNFLNTLEKTIQNLHIILNDTSYKHHNNINIEYLGFIWWQGYSDCINGMYRNQYQDNLVSFFNQIRTKIRQPQLPIIVVELGYSGATKATKMEYEFRTMQQNVVDTISQQEYDSNKELYDDKNNNNTDHTDQSLISLVTSSDIAETYLFYSSTANNSTNSNPRTEIQYYYGRADVMLQISQRIAMRLIELNERKQLREQNWLYHKWLYSIHSSSNGQPHKVTTMNNDNEEEEFGIAQTSVSANTFLIVLLVGIAFVQIQQQNQFSNIFLLRRQRQNHQNNNSNFFTKVFRPTLETINEQENDDDDNTNNITHTSSSFTDDELNVRAKKYGVQPQY